MTEKLWDYLVIHVNFEPGKNSDSKTDNLELATEKLQGSLSPEYLQKEFPQQFKKKSPTVHPSKQLEGFLKRCGNEGWELKTTERVGGLLMFIFMKPKIFIAESQNDQKINNVK
tara:strand:- start:122 stop:463 length:342 start_codon:yes stop_codon:yes gene_type:complete